ncbi:MAG: benzoyl-CoA reductase subunit C [Alphaproteobacteria bacterium]|jgi:benzoyl-CoA reductase subunit C|nr:benzoyl-CoA reductase subunit C [Alphaproteobacteria bacterium]MBT4085950.1 benzoyl-CoA reductase subunit C [Alphaproteobacteria bacterium]MBT4542577.1 benzoyl-CoA reductase subunit C [Alphaproteobacteria bacterium]MBT7746781.1 benzoyl-CoA reductase subunit C [Alphaproteobacteria bacterium]
MSVQKIVDRCQALYDDLDFTVVKEWKAKEEGRKAIGYMPVYVPREIIHAAGMLPVGVIGGGDQLEVIHGDAYYQSYICRIPRSTIELGVTGRLDCVDGMLFPSICDVIRNLSGMWKLLFKDKYVRYFDAPQTYDDKIGGKFYVQELRELIEGLEELGGKKITEEAIHNSIAVYNENRAVIEDLYAYRSKCPWKALTSEIYLLLFAGMVLPVEEHTQLLRDYLEAVDKEDRPMRDNCRVVLNGTFCERPPLGLIKSIEMAGCYIVDDDFMLVTRWLLEDVPTTGDPVQNLADAFLHHSAETAAKYVDSYEAKGQFIVESVKKYAAEGVVFAAPSFCDPALLDQPMLHTALNDNNIPFTAFQYAENSGQMQPIREQAGTFADSIKLWSA